MRAHYLGLTSDKQHMQFIVWVHKVYLPYSCYELEEKELTEYLSTACAGFTSYVVLN